jgi:hypothetical protein
MTPTRDEITTLIAKLQVEAELNPSRHSALMKEAAAALTELLVIVVAYGKIEQEKKPS